MDYYVMCRYYYIYAKNSPWRWMEYLLLLDGELCRRRSQLPGIDPLSISIQMKLLLSAFCTVCGIIISIIILIHLLCVCVPLYREYVVYYFIWIRG